MINRLESLSSREFVIGIGVGSLERRRFRIFVWQENQATCESR